MILGSLNIYVFILCFIYIFLFHIHFAYFSIFFKMERVIMFIILRAAAHSANRLSPFWLFLLEARWKYSNRHKDFPRCSSAFKFLKVWHPPSLCGHSLVMFLYHSSHVFFPILYSLHLHANLQCPHRYHHFGLAELQPSQLRIHFFCLS